MNPFKIAVNLLAKVPKKFRFAVVGLIALIGFVGIGFGTSESLPVLTVSGIIVLLFAAFLCGSVIEQKADL